MKYDTPSPPTKIEKRAGMRKCRNVACGGFIETHQAQFNVGYCTEWCKEIGISRQRKESYKQRKIIRESRENKIPLLEGISYLQRKWLNSRGGRTDGDVLTDDKGYYVEMQGRNLIIKKVYLP